MLKKAIVVLLSLALLVGCSTPVSDKDGTSTPANSEHAEAIAQEEDSGSEKETPEELEPESSGNSVKSDNNRDPVSEGRADINKRVHLRVTRDFGRQVLFSDSVAWNSKDTVLSLLKRNLDVNTAYGGEFVKSIAGLESGFTSTSGRRQQMDWLYWVNGVAANRGPNQYDLKPGDHIWWDYQSWGQGQMANAVVGAFPHPFVGSRVEVLYAPGCSSQASTLKARLEAQGATGAKISPLSEAGITGRSVPTLVVGTWENLGEISEISTWMNRGVQSGIYLRVKADGIEYYNSSGNVAGVVGAGSGAIWSFARGPGDRAPVVVITGTTQEGVDAATNIFINNVRQVEGVFALVVSSNGILRLPRP